MNVKIINKPAFNVIGIEGSGSANKGSEWILPLWDKARSHFKEIENLVIAVAWGLMSAKDDYLAKWKDEGKYLAGWETKSAVNLKNIPQRWALWEVPKTTFAAVSCTMDTYGEAMQFFYNKFLSNSRYKEVGAIHEFYPPDFKEAGDKFYLYFTIAKK